MNIKNQRRTWVAAAITAALLAGCASRPEPSSSIQVTSGTVIRDVNIVNTRDGSIARHMTLILDGGRILKITGSPSVIATGGAQLVEGSGKYLVPGYIDMHTQALGGSFEAGNLALLASQGVTGIREVSGRADVAERARAVNRDRSVGRLDVPEVLAIATVPSFGVPIPQGRRTLEMLGDGPGLLLDCSLNEGAIRDALVKGDGATTPPPSPEVTANPWLFRGQDVPLYQRVLDSYSEQKCASAARLLARSDIWNVPMLARMRALEITDDPRYRNDANLKYVDRDTAALWQGIGARYTSSYSRPAAKTLVDLYARQKQVVRLLSRSGVKIMTGSDAGSDGIWSIPGYGLHREFQELGDAGLTPLEVLQAATLNAAQFLGRESTMGTVAEGRNADLVLLDGNPIDSTINLDRISAVVMRGKVIDRNAIANIESSMLEMAVPSPVNDMSPAQAMPLR